MAVLRLARQVLFEPQFVGKESQGLSNGLPNLTQVMDSGQIAFLPLYRAAVSLKPVLTHESPGALEVPSICLQKSPQTHRPSLDAQREGMGWSLGPGVDLGVREPS